MYSSACLKATNPLHPLVAALPDRIGPANGTFTSGFHRLSHPSNAKVAIGRASRRSIRLRLISRQGERKRGRRGGLGHSDLSSFVATLLALLMSLWQGTSVVSSHSPSARLDMATIYWQIPPSFQSVETSNAFHRGRATLHPISRQTSFLTDRSSCHALLRQTAFLL